eukprot:m.1216549 g.1216549  ORF g.1216549 m.1216549 type:complete len:270 (+) comp24614_c0_seq4:154-963(+)
MKKFGALFGCTALLSVSVSTYAAPAYVDFVEPRARGNDSVVYNPDPMSAGASGLTTFNVSNMDVPGTFGVDMSVGISKTITEAKWSCMHTTGNYQFAIVEGWQGGYGQNTGLASAVKDAWNAGFKDVDVYAFMCPNCHNSAASATQLVNYLKSNNVRFGMIWLDVEQCSGCWSTNLAANCEFVKSLASEYLRLGVKIGVYSSEGEWPQTVGASCTGLNAHPLWYAHYDGVPSFSDGLYRFGGWTKPAIKQFADSAGNSCGISVDRSWYP